MDELRALPLTSIRPDAGQPRKDFNQEKLEELAASMKAHGLRQPIAVRPDGDGFIIILGERRWRAAGLLDWLEIPALISESINALTAFELALVENVVREDLNAMEEARAYDHLLHGGITFDAISERFGKAKNYIAWRVALLNLREDIQHLVAHGQMTAYIGFLLSKLSLNGQARALRLMNAEPMTMVSVAAMANRLWLEENEVSMFGEEVEQSPAARQARRSVEELLRSAGRAASAIDVHSDHEINEGIAGIIGAADKIDALMRVLSRLRRIARRRQGQLAAGTLEQQTRMEKGENE